MPKEDGMKETEKVGESEILALHKARVVSQLLNTKREIVEQKLPDSLEVDFGGTGKRGKFYFDADDLEGSLKRLNNFFAIAKEKQKQEAGSE